MGSSGLIEGSSEFYLEEAETAAAKNAHGGDLLDICEQYVYM